MAMKQRSSLIYTVFTALLFGTSLLLFAKLTEDQVAMVPPAEYVYWEEASQAQVTSSFSSEETEGAFSEPESLSPEEPVDKSPAPSTNGTSLPDREASVVGKADTTNQAKTPAVENPGPGKSSSKIYIEVTPPNETENDGETVTSEDTPWDEDFPEEEPDEAPSQKVPSENSSSTVEADPNRTVNLNAANMDDLCSLDGIGEVLAQRIIDYRKSAGGFSSIEELMNVKGIAEKKFAAIRDRLVV